MITTDEVIEELVDLILILDDEIKKLNERLERMGKYIEVYEEYIKGNR